MGLNLNLNNDGKINALVPSVPSLSLNVSTVWPSASILNTLKLTVSKTHMYGCSFPQFSRTSLKQFFTIMMFTNCDMETWLADRRKIDFLLCDFKISLSETLTPCM